MLEFCSGLVHEMDSLEIVNHTSLRHSKVTDYRALVHAYDGGKHCCKDDRLDRIRRFNAKRDFIPEAIVFPLESRTMHYLANWMNTSKVLLD